MPDPTIDAALAEITEIIKKHDLSGVVLLGSRTHVQFAMPLQASWNGFFTESISEGFESLRVRVKREDFPDSETARECLCNTIGQVLALMDVMEKIQGAFSAMAQQMSPFLEAHVSVEEPQRRATPPGSESSDGNQD